MLKRVLIEVTVGFFLFSCAAFAKELPTQEEKAYFQKWSQEQDRKFPRQKRTVTLSNGLEAHLIQDPRAKKASVGLDVAVGEANDPPEYLGLAHYLEHMVFISTSKYPELNGFDRFTADHNGSSNAFTDTYHTNYFFDVNGSALEEGLDRFAQFFISPTFDPSQLAKELEAVDAEYQKNIQQDIWGLIHVLNSLSHPDHPRHRDFQGNKETLAGVTQDTIRKFFETHYSAHLMKLVVISAHDLAEVEGWVRCSFGQVRTNFGSQAIHFSAPFLPTDQLPRLVTYRGLEAKPVLTLEFELPAFDEFKYSSPSMILSSLISSRRPGMLQDALIKKGWITELGVRPEDLGGSQVLDVAFQLTEQGLAHWKDVVFEFYQAIELLRKEGLPHYVYDELKLQGELEFLHSAPGNDMDRASSIASRLQHWSSEEIEGLETLTVRYAPQTFLSVLASVRPERMQVLLTDGDLTTGVKDPFYNLHYQVRSLGEEELKHWNAPALGSHLVFPQPNPYIPTDFSLRGVSDEKPVLLESPGTRLWVQTDHQFETPKADWVISALSDRKLNRQEEALRLLYLRALDLAVLPVLSQAESFGYVFSPSALQSGLWIRLSGFSDGFARFSKEIVNQFDLKGISDAEFRAIQENLLVEIDDELTQESYELARSRMGSLLGGSLTLEDIRDELAKASLTEVIQFAKEFWTRPLFYHAAAFGNVAHEEALAVLDQFRKDVGSTTNLPRESIAFEPFVALEKASTLIHEVNSKDQNHGVVHYLSLGKSTASKKALLGVLELLTANQFFKDLRTEAKIGYIASFAERSNLGQCGMRVLVQSSWEVEKIDEACLGWVANLPKFLSEISEANFRQVKASLLEELRMPHFTFEDSAAHMLESVFHCGENFGWKQQMIEQTEKLEQSELVSFVRHKLDPVRRRLLSVYALGDLAGAGDASGSDSEASSASQESTASGQKRKRSEVEPCLNSRSVRERITTEGFAASSRKYLVPRFR
jgi:hypothetical protein